MSQKLKKNRFKIFRLIRFLLFSNSKQITIYFKINKKRLNKILFSYCLQLSFLYVLIYILVYFFNYDLFSKSNEILESTSGGDINYYFNAYPFNVWYLFMMWFVVNLFLFALSSLILTFLSENKKPAGYLFSNSIYSTSFIFASCFPLLVINAIYPINSDTTIASFSFLVSLWILILGLGIIFSAIRFGQVGKTLLNQNSTRAIFSWVLSCFSLVYFIYKILT